MSLVEVRESKIHGYGVFAIADIKKGEVITQYDGKILKNCTIVSVLDYKDMSNEDFYFIMTHQEYMINHRNDDNCIEYIEAFKDKKYNRNQDKAIYGYNYEELLKNKSTNYGSLINDGDWDGDINKYEKKMTLVSRIINNKMVCNNLYNDDGMITVKNDNNNCCFKRECIPKGLSKKLYEDKISQHAVIATRDIKKVEEILTHYGVNYWKELEITKAILLDGLILKALDHYMFKLNKLDEFKKLYEAGTKKRVLKNY